MNDWFTWNGTRCTQYGIHVLEQPVITRPSERATFSSVPGRSGTLTTLEGDDVYDDMILTATCMIENTNRLSEINKWLKGGGTVTFANRSGGYYKARIINQLSFEKILRGNPHLSFAVNFRCQPFFYISDVQNVTLTASGSAITNPYSAPSEPIITVNGSGEITFMIGLTILELTDVSGSVTLNSELMEAYSGTTSLNANVSGEYPTLIPGMNAISWSGDVTNVVIQPNWREL